MVVPPVKRALSRLLAPSAWVAGPPVLGGNPGPKCLAGRRPEQLARRVESISERIDRTLAG